MDYDEAIATSGSLDSGRYIAWAGRLLNGASRFTTLRDAFPELVPPAKVFNECFATLHMGAAVVFAFKKADEMNYADVRWHLTRLLDLVPRPGAVDAMEYVGMLVLVFERPLDPAKRDKLVGLKDRRLLRRGFVQVVIVELAAGALWTSRVPRVIKPLIGYLSDALSQKGDPPPLPPPPPLAGQKERSTAVAVGTLALVAVLCATHLMVALSSMPYSLNLRLLKFGSDHPASVVEGESWRMVSALFLHAGWPHLLGNLVGIYQWGRGVEPLFGTGWLLAIFLITGFSGEVLTNLFSSASMSVGASGAAFGLCGALTAVYVFRKTQVTLRSRGQMFFWAILVGSYLIWNGASNPVVNNFAHFGGFFSGFLLGRLLPFKMGGKAKWGGPWWGFASAAASLWAFGGVAGTCGPDTQRYRDVTINPLRVSYAEPAGWYKSNAMVQRGEGITYRNGAGGVITFVLDDSRLEWLLPRTQERENILERFYSGTSKNIIGMNMEKMEDVWAGGGKAIKVTYMVKYKGRGVMGGSDYYLPRRDGCLILHLNWPVEDADYYKAIFNRVTASLVSLEPPVEPKPLEASP